MTARRILTALLLCWPAVATAQAFPGGLGVIPGGVIPGGPVVIPADDCFVACEEAYRVQFEACVDEAGQVDEECLASADEAFLECVSVCEPMEPPPEVRCMLACEEAFILAFEECHGDDGQPDEECFVSAEMAFAECAEACIPEEIRCVSECDRAYFERLQPCISAAGVVDPACAEAAHSQLEDCLEECGVEIPPEVRCASECDLVLSVSLAACETGECIDAAFSTYAGCLGDCGVAVPPLPTPDSCVTECDLRFSRTIESCMEADADGDGQPDDPDGECFRLAEEDFVRCLEGCDVVVEIPDVPPSPCVGECDESFALAFEECFDPETGAADDACFAAIDGAYLECLEACGVEIPEFPGLPASSDCLAGCSEALEALADCEITAAGDVDEECFRRLEDEFAACIADCEESDDAGQRALVAKLRASSTPKFLRGDANQDDSVNLADAVFILNELFVDGEPTSCRDAADANDDGAMNIADASAILGALFGGGLPLPEPTGVPGVDPTSDGLSCEPR